MSAIVELRDVRFRWQSRLADVLRIDSLVINPGERVFIRGASGSGKTTLLSLVGGIVTPQEGEVHVLGTRVDKLGNTQRDRFRADHIGFIFQMFNLIPYLSLLENVILPCGFSPRRRTKVTTDFSDPEKCAGELLLHLGLDPGALEGRPVIELSVGQQQRVAVARAIVSQPRPEAG